MSILGNRVQRVEDPRFLTGAATYVEDLPLEDSAWVTYVRSPYAHARITTVDVDEARASPGVLGVFSAADIAELPRIAHTLPMLPDGMRRPLLATDVVRFVGEPVAVVVAEDRYLAADAADLVVVDYEALAPAVDPESAVTDEVVLFPEVGTNAAIRLASPQRADFSGCEVVVELRVENQRMTAAPIEPRSGAAYWTDDGRLVHYSACQGAHPAREALCAIYGLPPEGIRVVVPDVGGGFGAKSRCQAEELLLGWLSRRLGRPVTWTETRTENMSAWVHGRGQVQNIKIGGTHDGVITAYSLDILQDAGGYPHIGCASARHDDADRYLRLDQRRLHVGRRPSRAPTGAFRGAGRPEATVAIERAVDLFAAEIGMDPGRCSAAQPVARVPRRTRPPRARSTTAAVTGMRSSWYSSTSATTTCAPNRHIAGRRATPTRSASGCRATSRSPAWPGPTAPKSTARSSSSPMARARGTPGRRRTGKGTTRRGACSSATSSVSPWTRSPSSTATPTSSRGRR